MPILVDLGPYLAEESVLVMYTRKLPGDYDPNTGRWIAGTPRMSRPIQAVVQPAAVGGRERNLSDLPEAIRNEILLFLWTEERLKLDDVVQWQDEFYRVMWIWDREHDGGYTRVAMGLLHLDDSTTAELALDATLDLQDIIDEIPPPPDPPDYVPPDPPPGPVPTPYDPYVQVRPQCAPSNKLEVNPLKDLRP